MTEDILASAIDKEAASRDFYSRVSEKITAKNPKKLLAKMAKDEEAHISILSRRFSRLFNKDHEPAPGELSDKHKIAESQVYDMDTQLEIASLGISMENESILFYAEQFSKTDDPEEKKMLKRLAQFETGHKKKLQHQYERLKKGHTWIAKT